MEDASCVAEGVRYPGCGDPSGARRLTPASLYCVFDGHGGRGCADFCAAHLVDAVTSDPRFASEPELALTDAFFSVDERVRDARDDDDCSGATALAACVLNGELVVANAGDCRAVLSREGGRAIDLSTDQKPTRASELERIERAGGFVEDGYVNGHLGAARAFGDFHIEGLKGTREAPGPLTVEPEVERWTLRGADEFVVIACDGLWDVFSSHNAIDFARRALRRHNDPAAAARELCEEALRRDSPDNVSVIVVCLSADPPPDKPRETRTAPVGIGRAISNEGLSSLQKALRSDDEAAREDGMPRRRLTRVSSINPSSPGRRGAGNGANAGLMHLLEDLEVNDTPGGAGGGMSPLAEEERAE